jgi:nucleoside 2-deoxyribosyltransferase
MALCGSMDFFDQMSILSDQLKTLGISVYLPTSEEVKIDYSASSDSELTRLKKQFIDDHLRKIRASDAVMIVNLGKRGIEGYIGANTLMEAAFAYALGKIIFVLHRLSEQPCRPEVLGMQPVFLDGSLTLLECRDRSGSMKEQLS